MNSIFSIHVTDINLYMFRIGGECLMENCCGQNFTSISPTHTPITMFMIDGNACVCVCVNAGHSHYQSISVKCQMLSDLW